ncbi:MAG TPA: hypothetical protein PKK83_18525 [Polyangiaceae bacterium]|nr:hypothetical protein [Polyangiaceae bacterium]HQM10388.1 hypothetical protein [Polyangiaceae bacterium]
MNRFGSSVFSVLKRQLLLMFCATWLSCSADPLTELVVVINSDMETPDEFDGFRVAVTDHEGALSTERYYFVGKEPGKVVLPADFGLVPKGGDASRKVAVEVWATLAGADLFSNRALTGFVKGKVLRLDMFLASRCLTEAKACKPNETCRVEGCVPEEIDPGSLPEYTPGSQPPATEWIAAIHSSRSSRWWNVALDSAGNSYAAGMFAGEFKAQGVTHTASSLYSAMIASYSPTGKCAGSKHLAAIPCRGLRRWRSAPTIGYVWSAGSMVRFRSSRKPSIQEVDRTVSWLVMTKRVTCYGLRLLEATKTFRQRISPWHPTAMWPSSACTTLPSFLRVA